MKYDYDIAILGGGSGGLVAASSTSQLGLKVLLIEKDRLGGDCLWSGCVPSKALIAVAKKIHDTRRLKEFGLPEVKGFSPSFEKIMDRMREVQATIQPHDSPERFRKLGADVQFGNPHFISKHEILLDKKRITFKYAIIATGSGPLVPNIPGLKESGFLTNVEVFELKKLPKRLVVIGAGPIGTELAQTFQRFGSQVTMVVRSKLLAKEDQDLVSILAEKLREEGVNIILGKSPSKIVDVGGQKKLTLADKDGKQEEVECDDIMLVATGRKPNIEGLQLEQAGIDYTDTGITVDEYLRTTARNIYAIGDVIGGNLFTHTAASEASVAVRNIITPVLKSKSESSVIPWVTFTDPEFARVGLTMVQAKNQGIPCRQLSYQFKDNDRAIAENETIGEIHVVVTPKGNILGTSILGPHAGELLQEYVFAMKHGKKIQNIASTIHPYPTLSGATWTLAGSYYKQFLTDKTKKLTQFLVRKL